MSRGSSNFALAFCSEMKLFSWAVYMRLFVYRPLDVYSVAVPQACARSVTPVHLCVLFFPCSFVFQKTHLFLSVLLEHLSVRYQSYNAQVLCYIKEFATALAQRNSCFHRVHEMTLHA